VTTKDLTEKRQFHKDLVGKLAFPKTPRGIGKIFFTAQSSCVPIRTPARKLLAIPIPLGTLLYAIPKENHG